jgi:NAD(P)H-nitrite reductase large subunit
LENTGHRNDGVSSPSMPNPSRLPPRAPSSTVDILSLPTDVANLSKGYLAGTASDASNLLQSAKFYQDHKIDLHLNARVVAIAIGHRQVELADGSRHDYDALLLATGAEPVRLEVPGADLPHVHYLRTLADSRVLVAKTLTAKRVAVIGTSFIGLGVAASLRARNIDVQVVGPETIPMEKILGPEVGTFIRKLHEEHGVTFHLGMTDSHLDRRAQCDVEEWRKPRSGFRRRRHRCTAGALIGAARRTCD